MARNLTGKHYNDQRPDITKEILENLYIYDKLIPEQISKMLKCTILTVRERLSRFGIPIRNNAQAQKKYTVNDYYFDEIDDEKAWLIGFIAADGYITKNERSFSISQSKMCGKLILEHIKTILKYDGIVEKCKSDKSTNFSYRLIINSPNMVKRLRDFKITRNKTELYEFPEIMIPWLYPFLRGFIDGDGCINVSRNTLRICIVGTEKFIRGCLENVPIRGVISKDKRSPDLWQIFWNGKKAIQLGKFLYSNNQLYPYYKREKYLDYLKMLKEKDLPWIKYGKLKIKVQELYYSGLSKADIVNEMFKIDSKLTPTTIYRWLK